MPGTDDVVIIVSTHRMRVGSHGDVVIMFTGKLTPLSGFEWLLCAWGSCDRRDNLFSVVAQVDS